MKKPRLSIEVSGIESPDGKMYQYRIIHKGKAYFIGPPDFVSDAEACEAAELKKIELQEAMMKAAPPPELTAALKKAKEKKPRKAKPTKPTTMFPEACALLEKAVTLIGAVSIKDAGEHIERLNKAMETIDNVRRDLSEIE